MRGVELSMGLGLEGSNNSKETVNKLGRKMVFCFFLLEWPYKGLHFSFWLGPLSGHPRRRNKKLKPVTHIFPLSWSVSLVPGLYLPCRMPSIPDIIIQLSFQDETDPLQVYSSVKLPNGKSWSEVRCNMMVQCSIVYPSARPDVWIRICHCHFLLSVRAVPRTCRTVVYIMTVGTG